MMVPPSVFSTVASSNSSHDPGSGDNLLPIGTERANKGTIAGGEVNAAAAGNSSSFSMLAPGECVRGGGGRLGGAVRGWVFAMCYACCGYGVCRNTTTFPFQNVVFGTAKGLVY